MSRGEWRPDQIQYRQGDMVEYQGKIYSNVQGHASSLEYCPAQDPHSWIYLHDARTYAYSPPAYPETRREGLMDRLGGIMDRREEFMDRRIGLMDRRGGFTDRRDVFMDRRERLMDRREGLRGGIMDRHLNHLRGLGFVQSVQTPPPAQYVAVTPPNMVYGNPAPYGGYPPPPNMPYANPGQYGGPPGNYPPIPQHGPGGPGNGPPNMGNNYPPPYNANGMPPHGVAYTAHNGVKVEQEDTHKRWHELEDKKKNALIAGGLVIGLAAIAGGAYYVHKKHQKEGEAMHAQAWDVQNWMITSNQKTELFLKGGPKTPTTWVYSAHIDDVKKDLIPGGEEDGQPWYIARAPHNGGLLTGKCRPDVGAFVGYDREAVQVKYYDVLVGDAKAVKWVRHKGHLSISDLGAQPIEGGHDPDGTALAIARGRAKEKDGIMGMGGGGKEGLFPGKASSKLDGAYITVGEKEVKVDEYEVLCYA
ncbi:hypothetical protein M0805_005694 [Coniferiporia weirii]|nr:hypothetical protein M0805_005694 [Coniferiporia weirii]